MAKENKLGEIFKKVIDAGVGAAFMTEDVVKGLVNDLPLSKDFINGLVQTAKTTRTEFISTLKTELKGFLGGVNISKEIEKVVENYDIEVNATFKFKPKAGKKATKSE